MSDQPQLSLGRPPEALQKKLGGVPRAWLLFIVFLNILTLVGVALLLRGPGVASRTAGRVSTCDSEELKAVAAELEDKSLEAEAAHAWEAYLAADPQCSQRAEILYRIGRLYMQAERFGPAAGALVRAEHAAADDKELKAKIGPQVVECLGRLGRYGEVGRELSRRVEATGGEQSEDKGSKKVLATLKGQNLTEADLDRMIERRVDHMFAIQGSGDEQQRKAILQQMSAPSVRRQLLEELLKTELFCRRARELGLDRQEDFQQARDQLSQNLLAERFLMRELDRIRPTEVDIESYFKAHAAQYETPETLQVVTLKLTEKEDAAATLGKIKSADDFRKLADERPSGAAKAASRPIVRGRADAELGDAERLFAMDQGQWTREAHANGKERFLVLVEKKSPRQTPQLQEVLGQVRTDYVARKQQELAQRLFADLTSRYDVRILAEAETPSQGGAAPDKDASPSKSKPAAKP